MIVEERDVCMVAYHPEQQTAVEIWDIDGTLFADVPGDGIVEGTQANEVLKAVTQSDQITMRTVQTSGAR